jgi:pyruvate,water dikinase
LTGYIIPFDRIGMQDVAIIGGKNASLGEMIGKLGQAGVRVPAGFATTAQAYRDFLAQDELGARIAAELQGLDVGDVAQLAERGRRIRGWILATPFPAALERAVSDACGGLAGGGDTAVAVRSSATAEDLPNASFAGQQETILNVRGIPSVLAAMHEVYASLYNDRAIAYRAHQGFEHGQVAISVGIQHMVRSDIGASGVLFTLDTESGFRDAVFITASWGLGELVVQGAVNPDEFYVYKPSLRAGRHAIIRRNLGSKATRMVYAREPAPGRWVATEDVPAADRARFCIDDGDVHELARLALAIEAHYRCPMDIEWGKDGATGEIYVLQARPETVQSRSGRSIQRFTLKARSRVLTSGRAIGQRIGAGTARIVKHAREMTRVQPGDVLVSDMTDPDWEPVMKRAAAIVTNRGGRTCHAAIIARELGIPAVVGSAEAVTGSNRPGRSRR